MRVICRTLGGLMPRLWTIRAWKPIPPLADDFDFEEIHCVAGVLICTHLADNARPKLINTLE